MKPLPVILVTGFLGSGKTTCLCQTALAQPEARLAFLVNELAERDVDGTLLSAATGKPSHQVLGGSLFCECKAGEFLRVLRENVQPAHREQPFDALLVETSGMADPGAIGTLLGSAGLDQAFLLLRIVTIVSPVRFNSLVRNLPVAEAQIRVADQVIINKCDLVDADTLDGVDSTVQTLNPTAEIIHQIHCGKGLDWSCHPRSQVPASSLSTYESNPFTALTVEPGVDWSKDKWQAWLEGLPSSILRVKGILRISGDWFLVQHTVDQSKLTPAPPGPRSLLVLIADDRDERCLQNIRATLQPQTLSV